MSSVKRLAFGLARRAAREVVHVVDARRLDVRARPLALLFAFSAVAHRVAGTEPHVDGLHLFRCLKGRTMTEGSWLSQAE